MRTNRKLALLLPLIVGTVLLVPAGVVSYVLYFAWDSQRSGEFYKIAFERDRKLYELNVQGSSTAFDIGTGNDHFYLSSAFFLGELIALSYGDFAIAKTDNPFFAGRADFGGSSKKYSESETKYIDARTSFQSYRFFDRDRNQIFAFEPGIQSEFVQKIRPTFPMFAKRRYSIGAKQDYVDVTKLLEAKLGKKLKFRLDDDSKLLILSFEN